MVSLLLLFFTLSNSRLCTPDKDLITDYTECQNDLKKAFFTYPTDCEVPLDTPKPIVDIPCDDDCQSGYGQVLNVVTGE